MQAKTGFSERLARYFFCAVWALVLPFPTGKLPADKAYFELTPAVREAYEKVTSLRFAEARTQLDQLHRNEPGNLLPLLVENYLDVLTVLADNDEATYRRLSKNISARLDRIEQGEPRSPWRMYCLGEIRLQWAILRSQYNDQLAGLNDFNLAYGLLQENQRLFPDFMPNKKSMAILHAALGNTPDEYKWAVRTFAGMSGSARQGMQEMETVLAYARQQDFLFAGEALTAYAFMQLYLDNDENGAWASVRKQTGLDTRQNPLAVFVVAGIGRRTGHNDEAIQMLENAPRSLRFYDFSYLDYQLGMAKLCRLDRDADQPLLRFAGRQGGQNGVKEAYQKLAWHELVQGRSEGYTRYMQLVKTQGAARNEPDKAALREANDGRQPDVRLLQARLLFDGGYYNRAFDLLKNAGPDYAADKNRRLEYSYRMGRIQHKLGNTLEAIRLYNQTIGNGATDPAYYACNAALQLGDLQAARSDYRAARLAYQQCLSLQPTDYAASLHARAKAGLNRIKGK